MKRVTGIFVCAFAVANAFAAEGKGYYRYPTLHGNTVVFTAEGDLWTVPIDGGVARRLTTHPSEETDATISGDGSMIAFTARYEGPAELYTMPITGGTPTRHTYESDASMAVGWTPQGEILYSTRRYSTLPNAQLVAVNPATHERRRIPLSQASDGVYSASGQTLFFARPSFHNNETKRYQGGTARNIWKFEDGADEAVNLTADFAGENHSPMCWENRVYYICDRDGTMNIWSMTEDGTDLQQHTTHDGWDVRSASMYGSTVAYQLGGDIRIVDIEAGSNRVLDITLVSDFDQLREKWVKAPMESLSSAHIDAEGERIVLTSRGRVFVAPANKGRLVRVSTKEGVRYRDAAFMPDGQVLTLSDESGEMEFVLLPGNGVGDSKTLTDDGAILRYTGHPSPDGKHAAYSDRNQDLWILNVKSGKQTRISGNRQGIGSMVWSPDSRWLVYSMGDLNAYSLLYLYDTDKATTTALTSDRVNSMSPAFSADGKWLYFLSDRNLRTSVSSPWGQRQPEAFFDKPMKIYQMALVDELRSPFREDDELNVTDEEADEDEKKDSKVKMHIDLDGIQRRYSAVPVESGNYNRLTVGDGILFYSARDSGRDGKTHLMGLPIGNKEKKATSVVKEIRSFEMSANGKKLLVRKGESLYVIDAAAKALDKLSDEQVDLSGWAYSIDVREDFRQTFIDAWRLERDFFYDENMHGIDWPAMRDKYLPLVDRVTTRMELSDLIGQMIGELSALHIRVRGGDHRSGPDSIRIATLGARLVREDKGYRIDHIYTADPDYPSKLSPLADYELGIQEGDIIQAINGVDTLSVAEPSALLRGQGGKQVLLTLLAAKNGKKRDVIVTPTTNESTLRYRDWKYSRRLWVEKKGEGDIGYVHLSAMGGENLNEWYRSFYPVFNRKGLVLDMRHNRGGNIDSLLLEKLIRRAWFFFQGRYGVPDSNQQYAFRGHMVVLCNELTASDGEAFTEGFRRLGLGKVIGTRTWGGQIWLTGENTLTDGGVASAAMFGVYSPEGEWLIEGHGVDPDIVVDNLPHETFKGADQQLDAAINHLQDLIRVDPRDVPQPPPYPDKSVN
jgi:tricorn protease